MFITFAIFVIKKTFKYIILKKKFVSNQIIKESIVKSRSTFIIFEIFTDFVEVVQVEIISKNSLNIISIFIAVFYRFNDRAHRRKNIQCFLKSFSLLLKN